MRSSSRPRGIAITASFCALTSGALAQTKSQTLPVGFDERPGLSSESGPVHTSLPTTWQWHYDSSNFDAAQEILIREIYLRAADPAQEFAEFHFDNFEVALIEATTDYGVGSHSPTFANNVRRREVVREGPWSGSSRGPSAAATAEWIPLQLTSWFTYDPSAGNDLIVEIRACGSTQSWQSNLDAVSGSPGTVGGNRYGNGQSCTATTSTIASDELVPVVRIDYADASFQTLPRGFDTTIGNIGSGPAVSTISSQRWQWHYDSTEFDALGPISITEVSVRPRTASATLNAFEFPSWGVLLSEAATDYRPGAHDATFSQNLLRARRVRSAPDWLGGPVPPSGGLTGTWVPLQLDRGFVYDPSAGNDFIVDLQKCGSGAQTWNLLLDTAFQGPSSRGARYGATQNCASATADEVSGLNVPIVRIHYVSAVVTQYPFFETFDDTPGFRTDLTPWTWQQPDDDGAEWEFRRDLTPTEFTGPFADHTSGVSGGGGYAYTEDSLSSVPAVKLESPYFDLRALANPTLSFWVHSNDSAAGVNENFLHVDAIGYPSGNVISDLITPIGHLGDEWRQFAVDLSAFSSSIIQIRFRGETDSGSFTHDIAIDDVRVFGAVAGMGQPPRPSAALDINDAIDVNGLSVATGVPGPFFARARRDGDFAMEVRGEPNRLYLMLLGPLNPGLASFPFGQVDVGPALATFSVPGLSRTNALGEARFSFGTPSLAIGSAFGFQAVVSDSSPLSIALSNAVEVTIVNH